jgi:hypothetical protein
LQETRDKLHQLLNEYNLEVWRNTQWYISNTLAMTSAHS